MDFPTKVAGKLEMAGPSPLSKEGSWEGCNCSRCGGSHVAGGSGMEVEEIQSPGGGGENQGQRWFNQENNPTKRRSLLHLECELDNSLMFEHGSGQ